MVNLTKSHLPDVGKYKEYINKIFVSGWLSNNGQFVQELQRRLQEYLGINSKMNEFQDAMGLCILDDMKAILEERKRVYDYYIENLPKELQVQEQNTDSTANYAYFPVVFNTEETLLKVKEKLNQNAINPMRYFYPSLDKLPYVYEEFQVPVATSISKRILCLPMYDTLSDEELYEIIKFLKEALQ